MIFNTVIQGSVTGVNGTIAEYRATEGIHKGDFIQLTTYGVEQPKFNTVLSWNTNDTKLLSSVKVLSSTQALAVWAELVIAGVYQLHAQAVTFIDGVWSPGVDTVLELTTTLNNPRIAIERLVDGKAIILFHNSLASADASSRLYVVDVANTGSISVQHDEDIIALTSGNGLAHVIAMSPTKFVVLGNKYRKPSSTSYVEGFAYLYTYENNVVTCITNLEILGNGEAYPFYACKLNADSILISQEDSYFRILTINGDALAVKSTSVRASSFFGPIVYWDENKVLASRDDKSTSTSTTTFSFAPRFITYTPAPAPAPEDEDEVVVGTLTVGEPVANVHPTYGTMNIQKMAEDKACLLMPTSMSSATVSTGYLGILDIVKQTLEYVEITYTPGSSGTYASTMDIAFGVLFIVSSATPVVLSTAPCVSEVTVAPYTGRIDGVALKSATTGQLVKIVTPREQPAIDEGAGDEPEDDATTEGTEAS